MYKPKLKRSFRFLTLLIVLNLMSWLPIQALPLLITTPSDGGEWSDNFTIVFTQPMQETISVQFQGTGSAVMECDWLILAPGQPSQILDCSVASGQLPPGGTVTWTINPGGTGMTTLTGTVIPETTGTFTVPSQGELTVSVFPSDGGLYSPTEDGPVVFSFNQPMDTTGNPSDFVTFDQGSWNISWSGTTDLECTPIGLLDPGTYNYAVTGLTSQTGTAAPEISGSFTVEPEGGSVDIFTNPSDGEVLMQIPGITPQVLFIFSEPMDASVNLDTAISFSLGGWDCKWTTILPNLPVTTCGCTPTGALVAGEYEYTLSGLRSAAGVEVPDYMGFFIVEGEGGGEIVGGDPAPDCVDPSGMVSFPKSLYVCGPELFSWNQASFLPGIGGGFVLDASAEVMTGTLSSLVLLDEDGAQTGGVLATDVETTFQGHPTLGLVLATRGGSSRVPSASFGVFSTGNAVTPVFQHQISTSGRGFSANFLPDGGVLVLIDENESIKILNFQPNGSLRWAKVLSSSNFGVDTTMQVNSQNSQISAFDNGDFLVVVSKRKVEVIINGASTIINRSASAVVTRMNSSGNVTWSKLYTYNDPLDSMNLTGPFQDNTLILTGSIADQTSSKSLLAKLDENGNVQWAREMSNTFLSGMGILPGGRLLAGGGMGTGIQLNPYFLTFNVAGTIERQVLVDSQDVDIGFASVLDNKIYFSILSRDLPSMNPEDPPVDSPETSTSIIGSSSLNFDSFQWKQYARKVKTAFLGVSPTTSELFYSSFREDQHRADILPMSSNLESPDSCNLFSGANVTTSNPNLTARIVIGLSSGNGAVGSSNFTPELSTTDISLQSLTAAEVDICDEGMGTGNCDSPVQLRITYNENTQKVILEFTSVSGCTHILQRSGAVSPANWAPIATIQGDGTVKSQEISPSALTEFYRVMSP